MAEQFHHGGRAYIKCHQKSWALKYLPFEQLRSQGRFFRGTKQGCTREGARGKTRCNIRGQAAKRR